MSRHFTKLASGIDVAPLAAQLDEHPDLWDANPLRRTAPGTPHGGMADIWVRYNDPKNIGPRFNDEHIPVWYPAWKALPALRPLVFDIMARVQGEMLCGVLITKIPPGDGIKPHIDKGWHAEFTEKLYLSVKNGPGAIFAADDGAWEESIEPKDGDLYLFDNRMEHWVENRSREDRITLIVCVRTDLFGRY